MMIDITLFQNYQKLETTLNTSMQGKQKIEGMGDVDLEARETKGGLNNLTFEKSLHIQYKTKLISSSNLAQNNTNCFTQKLRKY